jgi:hypothetical protein
MEIFSKRPTSDGTPNGRSNCLREGRPVSGRTEHDRSRTNLLGRGRFQLRVCGSHRALDERHVLTACFHLLCITVLLCARPPWLPGPGPAIACGHAAASRADGRGGGSIQARATGQRLVLLRGYGNSTGREAMPRRPHGPRLSWRRPGSVIVNCFTSRSFRSVLSCAVRRKLRSFVYGTLPFTTQAVAA